MNCTQQVSQPVLFDEDVAEFIKPGDLKRMAQWAKEAHALWIEHCKSDESGWSAMEAPTMRNAVWLEIPGISVAMAILLWPPGGVIIDFWQWDDCWQTNEDGSLGKEDRMFKPVNSFGILELPLILAAMPEAMAIAQTFGELYPGGPPGGRGSDPDRRGKREHKIIDLFGRRAA